MLIGIDTPIFDPDGSFLIDIDEEGSIIQENRRRVTRTPTLDGNVSIVDCGHSHGDRDITFVFDMAKAAAEKLWALFRNYSEIILTLPDGVYNANIEYFDNRYGRIRLRILIESCLTQ